MKLSQHGAALKKKKIFDNNNQMIITSRKKQNNTKKSRYPKNKKSGGLPFFDGQIFDQEILLDNTAIYVDCIFANGISFSSEISEIIDGLLFKCMVNGPIIIPDNIIKIGNQSFYECKMGENSLTLSKNIKHISDNAFYNSSFGKSLFFPKKIEYIGKNAFAKCNNVKSIVFHNECAINEIKFQTFYNCLLLEKIVLPMNLISIGDKAFSKCVNLQTIENLNNTQYIGIQAFSYCFDLNIDINNLLQSVKTIRKTAFNGCYKIRQQNRPSPNIFSRVFQEQFDFDLYKHSIQLNLPKMRTIGTYSIHGDIKNPYNLNGFCKIVSTRNNNHTIIGHYINNKREGFILNKERYESNIIEYTDDVEKMDSYQFKNILTNHHTILTSIFEYKNTTFIDKSGNKINIMKGILNIPGQIFIGIWNKKDDYSYYFNGYTKKTINQHIERLENGVHSFDNKIYSDSEIEYLSKIDIGDEIFKNTEKNFYNIFISEGWQVSYESTLSANINKYRNIKKDLLQFNIQNFDLFPELIDERAYNLINIYTHKDIIYKSIEFIDKKSTIDSELDILIKQLNDVYNTIKETLILIFNIYFSNCKQSIPEIEKYFDDLEKQQVKIHLPIHDKLRSVLLKMKSEIDLFEKVLTHYNSPKNILYVINDETQIYLQKGN